MDDGTPQYRHHSQVSGTSDTSLVENLLSQGVMIAPDALDYLNKDSSILSEIGSLEGINFLSLKTLENIVEKREAFDKEKFVDAGFRIIQEYKEAFDSRGEVKHFIEYFSSRYEQLSSILKGRPELSKHLTSCTHLSKRGRMGDSNRGEKVSIVGMIYDKRQSKAGHVILTVEDPSGSINVILLKDREVFTRMSDQLLLDEVIGVSGGLSRDGGAIFASEILTPDVPLQVPWPENGGDDGGGEGGGRSGAVFISDIHVGSKVFMKDSFDRFLEWIGDDNNPAAKGVKYLFIAGDLVDGVGVYKSQQNELEITDIIQQYDELARLLHKIPKRVTIFACPGNHDAARDAEPQPPIPEEFAKSLYSMKNMVMTSSPSYIKVEGVTVLMNHGNGLDGVIAALPGLRKTGYDRPEQSMIQLLKKRHLMPVYGDKSKIFPGEHDGLVIKELPNVFHAGHVHSFGFHNYRGIRVLNSSTFQDRTSFQVKMGHHPTPGRIPFMNLRTGKVGVMDFSMTEDAGQAFGRGAEDYDENNDGGVSQEGGDDEL